MIQWAEILETGYPEIDTDHRRLVDECNGLTRLVSGRGSWNDVVEASGALARNFIEHFRTEEQVLDRTEFPRAQAHKMQHRQFEEQLNRLTGFLSGADGSQPEHWNAVKALRDTVVDILFRHDLDYKSHLEQAAGH
ncbi:MAG TPA: hemerythrin domain-containing protein [Dongiaceae bacterium]|jgi:hemerythrin-like metal-binding protein|nr:hemerythrin domain-containing protein [Dongiaceae bacterium]